MVQGLATFANVPGDSVISATYTAAHGISPGVCTLTILPDAPVTIGGNLTFSFGTESVTFQDCRADLANLQLSEDGFHRQVQILDRRWKWRYGEVNGFYNRRDDTKNVIIRSEKTPQELAIILLSAMGETGFDVTALPNEARPLIEWVGANPAEELARLCDELGCRIVLHLDNRVRIHRLGVGAQLLGIQPGVTMASARGVDPPEKPDFIKVFGAPTLFQMDLPLEAVGMELDGTVLPIDQLSYRPASGWERSDPRGGFPSLLANPEARQRAKDTVFRWYRPRVSVQFPIIVGTQGFVVTDLDQILPLFSTQVETYVDAKTGQRRQKPAEVYGLFYRDGWHVNSTVTVRGTERWTNGFTILGDIGVVEFPVWVRKRAFVSQSTFDNFPQADLKLRTSFLLRTDINTGEYHRVFTTQSTGAPLFGTGPEVIDKQDEIQLQEWETLTTWLSNRGRDNISQRLAHYVNAAQLKHQLTDTGEDTYAGIVPVDLDGAIMQVTYSVGPDGAETRASRNREVNPFIPTYDARRKREQGRDGGKEAREGKNEANRERHHQRGVRV